MITRLQKIRLAIFFIVALVGLVILLSVIIIPKLLRRVDIYKIRYSNISLTGLQEGSSVKYHGLNVGSVSNIFIDPEDVQSVIVEVSLKPGTPVKKDTRADITMLGITGLKVIELRGGSNESEYLKQEDFILPGGSITDIITGKAEVIAEKAEMVLNNISDFTSEGNRQKMVRLIESTSKSMEELQALLAANKDDFKVSMRHTREVTGQLEDLLVKTNSVMAQVNFFVQSDSLKQVLGNVAAISKSLKEAELAALIGELKEAVEHSNSVLQEIDFSVMKSRAELGTTIASLEETVDNLNQIVRSINENPSVLIWGTKIKDAPDKRLEK